MSMALFCATVQNALFVTQQHIFTKHAGKGMVVALADDTTFLAPPDIAFEAVDLFVKQVERIGLRLNPSKSSTLCINPSILAQTTALAAARGFPAPVQCLDVLGSHVGTKDLETQALLAHFNSDMFRRLKAVRNEQVKLLILRYSLISTCTFFTRTMPPDVSAPALLKLRKHVHAALADIMGLRIVSSQQTPFSQPASGSNSIPPPVSDKSDNVRQCPTMSDSADKSDNVRQCLTMSDNADNVRQCPTMSDKSDNTRSARPRRADAPSCAPTSVLSMELLRIASLSLSTGGLGLTDLFSMRHSAYYASVAHAVKTWSTWLSPTHPIIVRWLDGSTRSSQLFEEARHQQVLLYQEYNTSTILPLSKNSRNDEGDKADPESLLPTIVPPALPQTIKSIPDMTKSAVEKVQKTLGKLHNTIMFRNAWRAIDVDDVPRRTQFLANTVPTSNLWLRSIPSNPKFKLDSFTFKFNLLQHFSLDADINNLLGVDNKMPCTCSKDISGFSKASVRAAGYAHFVNCTHQSAFTARHNLLIKVIADATRAAGLNPQLEAMVSRAPLAGSASDNHSSQQKRFDVTVAGADELLVLHVDASVTSSRQQDKALAQGGAKYPLHAAKHKVQQKIAKYQDNIYPDVETLLPLVAETSGAIHPNFAKFYTAIGARVDNRPPLDAIWTTPTFASYWLAITSVTLRRATARACQRLANAALDLSGKAGMRRADTTSAGQDL
jgi:hypothetical protein